MAVDTSVTVVGNLVHDPEIAFSNEGKARVSFSIAVNKETQGGEKYTSYFDVTVWGKIAENISNSLHKGDRVVVFGQLKQSTFEAKDGSKKSKVEIVASDVAASLLWSSVTINK